MSGLREGSPEAADVVFRRFAARLIGLARLNLDARVRQKVDPEDIVQSVLKSFFWRHADGQFELDDWDSLWRLLVVITLRKCGREVKRFFGPHHDVRQEMKRPRSKEDSRRSWQLVDPEPTPAEAVRLADLVEQCMKDLSDIDAKSCSSACKDIPSRKSATARI